MTKSLCWLALPLSVIPIAYALLGRDLGHFLVWWLALGVIGWLFWPVAARLFPDGDQGYLLAKPIGLALSTLVFWTLSYLKILKFTRPVLIVVLLGTGLLAWLWQKNGWQLTASKSWPSRIRRAAAGELIFGLALLAWTFARGLKPEIDGLEKFMDVGFMNTIWRTDYLPAADMWLSGHSINYYYYGQYAYTFVAKLVGLRPEISYNLAMATTFAMAFALSYAAVSQIFHLLRASQPKMPRALPAVGGLLAGGLVSLTGNSHAFFYADKGPGQRIIDSLVNNNVISGLADKMFWFADSTRFIGYNPDTGDKTIHEFPFYSFLVADLHAHVVNLAFVLLLVALLARLVADHRLVGAAENLRIHQQQDFSSDRDWHRSGLSETFKRFKALAANGKVLMILILLSIAMMGNYWDFAIYLTVLAIVLFLINIRSFGTIRAAGIPVFLVQCALLLLVYLGTGNPIVTLVLLLLAVLVNHYLTLVFGDALTLTGAQISWAMFLPHLLTLPFSLGFESIAKSLALTVSSTPLWQLLILWGPHVLAALLFIVFLLTAARPGSRLSRLSQQPPDRSGQNLSAGRLARFIRGYSTADLLMVVLAICAIGLLIVPELIYVVDIYSGDYKRANTMFKFTYQAFVLLSLVWGYAVVRVGAAWIRWQAKLSTRLLAWPAGLIFIVLVVALVLPAWYPAAATTQWLGDISVARYQGLDGLVQFGQKNSDKIEEYALGELAPDLAAINWLNQNVEGQPVILEAAGESYTDYCRISAFTGLPTVMGWETHEWLWRTSKSTPEAYGSVVWPRQEDVRLMYTTSDQTQRIQLLDQYDITYIIIGDLERAKYSETLEDGTKHSLVQEDLLLELGDKVFEQDEFLIIQLPFNG